MVRGSRKCSPRQCRYKSDKERESMNTNTPVAIIGFGPAGVNAAISLRNNGYTGEIDVFTDTDTLPYSPILTSYYVSGEKSYDQCFPWKAEEIDDLDLNIHMNSKVIHMDVENHVIETAKGTYPYSKCVIATGSRPVANGFPKDCGYEPLMLRTMSDAEAMKQSFESETCKKVLVSGASMVALKILEAALAKDLKTVLVGMNSNILDFNALPETAVRFEQGLVDRGVSLRLGQTINDVKVIEDPAAHKGRRLKVSFTSGDVEEFDEVCVAHGMACNLDFIENGALDMDPAILVDEYMRSSDKDVYAAGDIAQALELVSGERKIVGIWKNAVNQGQLAGRAIAAELMGDGVKDVEGYPGSISSNTIAVDGLLFVSGGTIDLQGPRTAKIFESDKMTFACIFEENPKKDGAPSIAGFNLTCDDDEAGGVAYDIGAMLSMRIESDFSE